MHHEGGGDEGRDRVQHGDGVTLIERFTQLLYGVQVLEIVLSFIRCICDVGIELPPRLQGHTNTVPHTQDVSGVYMSS